MLKRIHCAQMTRLAPDRPRHHQAKTATRSRLSPDGNVQSNRDVDVVQYLIHRRQCDGTADTGMGGGGEIPSARHQTETAIAYSLVIYDF